jgi:anti-sigma B factor antagonist
MSQPQPRRRLEVKTVEGVTVVRFAAPRIVQEEDIQATFEQLQGVLDEKRVRDLVLDFRKVQFLSSAVLGRLILAHKKLQSAGGRVVLCGVASEILEVFKITKLDKVFTITEDAKAALAAFGVHSESTRVELED